MLIVTLSGILTVYRLTFANGYGILLVYTEKEKERMWTITEKQYTNEDGESYTGYGVEFGKCLVEDITPSRTAIQQFADALNRFDASPVHIYEIIENYLAELC